MQLALLGRLGELDGFAVAGLLAQLLAVGPALNSVAHIVVRAVNHLASNAAAAAAPAVGIADGRPGTGGGLGGGGLGGGGLGGGGLSGGGLGGGGLGGGVPVSANVVVPFLG